MAVRPEGIQALRTRILDEMDVLRRDAAKAERGRGPLVPKVNWDTVWVLSGPEFSFDPYHAEDDEGNQNEQRFKTGCMLLREVTARRMKKPVGEVTPKDVAMRGPTLYYNGQLEHNQALKALLQTSDFESQYGISASCVRITENTRILHTGHQIADFPESLVPKKRGRKVAIVSDVYHLPRVRRSLRVRGTSLAGSEQQIVLVPSNPSARHPVRTEEELDKIPRYIADGALPEE